MASPTKWKLLSSVTLPLTPELVAEQKAMASNPCERDVNTKRVDFLLDRLRAGLFHPPYWVRAVVDGKAYRANGQHTSHMLSQAKNGEFPEELTVHIDTFECLTMDDLALLFRQLDDRRSARSPGDVSGAYQGLQSDLNLVPRSAAKLCIEGVCYYRRQILAQRDTPRGDDAYQLFNETELHPFVKFASALLVIQEVKQAAVVAAMFACWQADPVAAQEFWTEVVEGGKGDYEESSSPAGVLYTWLRDYREDVFELPKKVQLYYGCIFGWNAMREGKSTLASIKFDYRKALQRVR